MNRVQEEAFRVLKEFDRICRKHNLKYSLSCGTMLGAVRHKGFIPWDDDVDVVMTIDDYIKFEEIVDSEIGEDFHYTDNKREKYYMRSYAKLRSNRLFGLEENSKHLPIHHGVWVDIFCAHHMPSDPQLQLEQFNEGKKYYKLIANFLYVFPKKSDAFPRKQIKYLMKGFARATYRINFLLPKWYSHRDSIIKRYNQSETEWVGLYTLTSDFSNHTKSKFLITDMDNLVEIEFENHNFLVCANYDEQLTRLYGDYMKLPKEADRVSHEISEVVG